MKIKKFFCYTSAIFLIVYVLGGVPNSIASTSSNEALTVNKFETDIPMDDHTNPAGISIDDHPDLLRWDMEIDDKTFKILVDRANKTIIVRGEAEDYKLKEKVENYVKTRAPSNFRIIYEIDILGTSERNRRRKSKQG